MLAWPQWEGGQYGGDENMRLDTLRLAKELGADYIDLELKVGVFRKKGTKLYEASLKDEKRLDQWLHC
ncbi:unnamed protein product [Camellia sinensis]